MKNFIEVGKTEEEQIEQIKKWIKTNGLGIIIGVLVGFGSIIGWDYYQDYQQQQSVKARALYLSLVNNPDNAQTLTADLQNNYPDSAYVQFANLKLAKNAVMAKDYPKALSYLQPILNHENAILVHIARLRIGSIYLEMGEYDKALSAIDTSILQGNINRESSFDTLYNHLKGDIYLAQKNIQAAKEYYQLTIQKLPDNSELKQLINIKLNELN